MQRYCTFVIGLVLMGMQGIWASPIPSPRLLLEAWAQLDTDFHQTIRSYKLQGVASRDLEAERWSAKLEWRVWRDGERFLWEYTIQDKLSGKRKYAYSFDGVRYYCYVSPSKQGFVYRNQQDFARRGFAPCENAFGSIYPFDIPQFWQKPLAGANWQNMLPYYATLLQNVSALRVRAEQTNQTYILLLPQQLQRRMVWLPKELHFRLEQGKFVPVRFVLQDEAQSTETVFEITSAVWSFDCWLPTSYRVTWRDIPKRQVIMETNATFQIYDINKPIPAEHFSYEFPVGTLVTGESGEEKIIAGASQWNLIWTVFAFIIAVGALLWIFRRFRR